MVFCLLNGYNEEVNTRMRGLQGDDWPFPQKVGLCFEGSWIPFYGNYELFLRIKTLRDDTIFYSLEVLVVHRSQRRGSTPESLDLWLVQLGKLLFQVQGSSITFGLHHWPEYPAVNRISDWNTWLGRQHSFSSFKEAPSAGIQIGQMGPG